MRKDYLSGFFFFSILFMIALTANGNSRKQL